MLRKGDIKWACAQGGRRLLVGTNTYSYWFIIITFNKKDDFYEDKQRCNNFFGGN